jgi:hypothetical protein
MARQYNRSVRLSEEELKWIEQLTEALKFNNESDTIRKAVGYFYSEKVLTASGPGITRRVVLTKIEDQILGYTVSNGYALNKLDAIRVLIRGAQVPIQDADKLRMLEQQNEAVSKQLSRRNLELSLTNIVIDMANHPKPYIGRLFIGGAELKISGQTTLDDYFALQNILDNPDVLPPANPRDYIITFNNKHATVFEKVHA